MHITKWNNVKTCELLSLKVSGWRTDLKSNFFPQRIMWKLLSLKQKMYHLCETHSYHMIPDLFYKRWLKVHLWMLSTKLSWGTMDFIHEYKSSETPTFVLSVLCFPLVACILAKTALHMKCYILKGHLRRKIKFSKIPEL